MLKSILVAIIVTVTLISAAQLTSQFAKDSQTMLKGQATMIHGSN